MPQVITPMLAALLTAFLTAQTADTATTVHLLRRGYTEANPLLPSSVRGIVLAKTAVTSAVVVTVWKARHRHPRLVRVALIVGAASATAATMHNARQMRR